MPQTLEILVKRPPTLPPEWPTEDALCGIPTPAFVYNEESLRYSSDLVSAIKKATGCRVLYAVKTMPFGGMLQCIEPALDGFAASSLFEAQLVRELFPSKQVHFTTPGLQPRELESLSKVCDYLTLNSINHVRSFGPQLEGRVSLGIRLNTELSFVEDSRYNPCRAHSKLGVPVSQLRSYDLAELLRGIQGLHIHTNADSTNLTELRANVDTLCDSLIHGLEIEWVNLGGGYLFGEIRSLDLLVEAVQVVKDRLNAKIFLEPGAALVRHAAVLVSQVIDLFNVGGKRVAVLDTTVNHMPEVLEFSYQPDVLGQSGDTGHEYILAGSTCLAGDVFGSYRLHSKLSIGERIVFTGVGAYTLAKAHRFNGVNLPAIWSLDSSGALRLRKQYDFQHYKEQWLADA